MSQLINIDETEFHLKGHAGNYGRGHISCRVRCFSHYKRYEPKLNVIMAIEPGNPNIDPELDGSTNRPRMWVMVTQQNCDQWIFADFVNHVVNDIETNHIEGGLT